MTKDNTSRVLCRVGARELTPQEAEHVSGGKPGPSIQTFDPKTHQTDGGDLE
jgi:hypothetical protein